MKRLIRLIHLKHRTRPEYLSLGTVNILGWIIIFMGICPGYSRIFGQHFWPLPTR